MMYYVYKILVLVGVLFPFVGVASTVMGIFIDGGKNEPWGEFAALCYVVGFLSAVISSIWAEDDGAPKKPMRLSREGRKQLRKAQDQAILDESIRRLERELRS